MSGNLRKVVWALAATFGLLLSSLPTNAKENVLIMGGAGHTGSAVARMLIARGDDVTVLVRATTDRKRLDGVPVQYVVADAMKADEMAAALNGKKYSVIFETIQVFPGSDQSWTKLYEVLMPLAKKMGAKQVVLISGGCGDRAAKDCPLSPPLYKLSADQTRAEHILRDSGVPYTIFRLGALIPSNPFHPDANLYSGASYLTEDLSKFGAVLRADMDEQIFNCLGSNFCINKIFVMDDVTVKPQLDHWLCKRAHETDTVSGNHPECGEMPRVTGATPRRLP